MQSVCDMIVQYTNNWEKPYNNINGNVTKYIRNIIKESRV
jgi:hypothetical protein